MTYGNKIIDFYKSLEPPTKLPKGVEILYPYKSPEVIETVEKFYTKYYNDTNQRVFLIGINPGRFGGGSTGIPFTDPVRLQEDLSIKNDFDKRSELSSNFIYQMISKLGGPKAFYGKFYITSVCPVGFTKDGKNLNYYDIKSMQDKLEGYMVDHLKKQMTFGHHPIAYSLGKGKNLKYLKWLNDKYQLFEKVKPLPHPRWVMQYRLKRLDEFIDQYKTELDSVSVK